MKEYRFKNLNIRHEGTDYLVNGVAFYTIEDYDDEMLACFEKAELYDALGKDGFVTSKEVLGHFADDAVIALNSDYRLCRSLSFDKFV